MSTNLKPVVTGERAESALGNDRRRRVKRDGSRPLVGSRKKAYPIRFLSRIVIMSGLMIAGVAGTLAFTGAAQLPFQVLIGLTLAHGTELIHQCIHKQATGRKRIDRWIGVCLGIPVLISNSFYQYWHLWHHRFNGTDKDRESFGYAYGLMESDSRPIRYLGLLFHLSMANHFIEAVRRMMGAFTGSLVRQLSEDGVPAAPARRIVFEYRLMFVLAAVAITAGAMFAPKLLIDLWLIPLMIWAPIHAAIELPEHALCDRPSSDTRTNTRSIKAGRFARWLTNFNCNHVGHHEDMNCPMHLLPEFEKHLQGQRDFKYIEESYPSFYWQFIKHLWFGPDLKDRSA